MSSTKYNSDIHLFNLFHLLFLLTKAQAVYSVLQIFSAFRPITIERCLAVPCILIGEKFGKAIAAKYLQINLENSVNGLGLNIFTKYSLIVLGDLKLYNFDHYSLKSSNFE